MVNKGIHGGQTKIQKYENGQDKKTKWSRQKNGKGQGPFSPLGLLRGFALGFALQKSKERGEALILFIFLHFCLFIFSLDPFCHNPFCLDHLSSFISTGEQKEVIRSQQTL